MITLKSTAAAVLFAIMSASLIGAQTSTGEVNGTVTDPNGAAVPGAVVKLLNQATRIESTATTNQTISQGGRAADQVHTITTSGYVSRSFQRPARESSGRSHYDARD